MNKLSPELREALSEYAFWSIECHTIRALAIDRDAGERLRDRWRLAYRTWMQHCRTIDDLARRAGIEAAERESLNA